MYLLRLGTEEKFELDPIKKEFYLGRHKDCDIQFQSVHVSRFHCKLVRDISSCNNFTVHAIAQNNRTYVDTSTILGPNGTAPFSCGSRLGLGVPFEFSNQVNPKYIYLELSTSATFGDCGDRNSSSNYPPKKVISAELIDNGSSTEKENKGLQSDVAANTDFKNKNTVEARQGLISGNLCNTKAELEISTHLREPKPSSSNISNTEMSIQITEFDAQLKSFGNHTSADNPVIVISDDEEDPKQPSVQLKQPSYLGGHKSLDGDIINSNKRKSVTEESKYICKRPRLEVGGEHTFPPRKTMSLEKEAEILNFVADFKQNYMSKISSNASKRPTLTLGGKSFVDVPVTKCSSIKSSSPRLDRLENASVAKEQPDQCGSELSSAENEEDKIRIRRLEEEKEALLSKLAEKDEQIDRLRRLKVEAELNSKMGNIVAQTNFRLCESSQANAQNMSNTLEVQVVSDSSEIAKANHQPVYKTKKKNSPLSVSAESEKECENLQSVTEEEFLVTNASRLSVTSPCSPGPRIISPETGSNSEPSSKSLDISHKNSSTVKSICPSLLSNPNLSSPSTSSSSSPSLLQSPIASSSHVERAEDLGFKRTSRMGENDQRLSVIGLATMFNKEFILKEHTCSVRLEKLPSLVNSNHHESSDSDDDTSPKIVSDSKVNDEEEMENSIANPTSDFSNDQSTVILNAGKVAEPVSIDGSLERNDKSKLDSRKEILNNNVKDSEIKTQPLTTQPRSAEENCPESSDESDEEILKSSVPRRLVISSPPKSLPKTIPLSIRIEKIDIEDFCSDKGKCSPVVRKTNNSSATNSRRIIVNSDVNLEIPSPSNDKKCHEQRSASENSDPLTKCDVESVKPLAEKSSSQNGKLSLQKFTNSKQTCPRSKPNALDLKIAAVVNRNEREGLGSRGKLHKFGKLRERESVSNSPNSSPPQSVSGLKRPGVMSLSSNSKGIPFDLDDFSSEDDDDLPDIDLPSAACTSTPVLPHLQAPKSFIEPIAYNTSSSQVDTSELDQFTHVRKPDSMGGTKSNIIENISAITSPTTDEPTEEIDSVILNIKKDPCDEPSSIMKTGFQIKQEKEDGNNNFGYEGENDDDDEDIQMIYSQMEDCILLSSDEEEMICSQDCSSLAVDESFGPIPDSPEPNEDDLFNKYSQHVEAGNENVADDVGGPDAEQFHLYGCKDGLNGPVSVPLSTNIEEKGSNEPLSVEISSGADVQLTEADSCSVEDNLNLIQEAECPESGTKKDNMPKTDPQSEPVSDKISQKPSSASSQAELKQSLIHVVPKSKHFKANIPRDAPGSSRSILVQAVDQDGLLQIVEKARAKSGTERSMKLTSPIIPLKSSKHNNATRPAHKVMERDKIPRSAPKKSKFSSPRKRRNSSECLRDKFAKNYKVKAYTAGMSMSTGVKHRATSSVKKSEQIENNRTAQSINTANVSNSSVAHCSKDHRYDFNVFRADENISVVKKSSVAVKPPTVAAKFTRKNRSQKLTEVNLFPSPEIAPEQKTKSRAKPKKSNVFRDVGQTNENADMAGENNVACSTSDGVIDLMEKLKSVTVEESQIEILNSKDSGENTIVPKSMQDSSVAPANEDCNREEGRSEEAVDLESMKSSVSSNFLPLSSGGILKKPYTKSNRGHISFPVKKECLERVRIIAPRLDKEKLGPNCVKHRELYQNPEAIPNSNSFPNAMSTNVDRFYLNTYYFVHKVCSWNYDWLKQYDSNRQKGTNAKPPPLLSNKGLVFPTLILYDSFKDYHEVFSVLLFYEVWEHIYRDWLKFHQTVVWFKCEVDVIRLNYNPAPAIRKQNARCEGYNFTLIKLVTPINHVQERQGLHPRTGSLVAIRVPIENRSTILFAYVSEHMRHSRTNFSKALRDAVPDATATLVLTVLASKGLATKIVQDSVINVCNVSYLKPSIRIWDGLTGLPNSPLGQYVLKPGIQCVMPPPIKRDYLVPEMPLNFSQLQAVSLVSSCVLSDGAPRISLIHGPPGTGKTRTLVALVAQLHRSAKDSSLRSRILLCAPSNAAVDELTRRLVFLSHLGIHLNVVRNGFPGRQCDDNVVQRLSFESLVEKRLQKVLSTPDEKSRAELLRMTRTLSIARSEMMEETDPAKKQKCQDRVVELVKRRAQFEKDCRQHLTPSQLAEQRNAVQREVLLAADVITSTLGSCCNDTVSKILANEVSVCIIDEAGQCTESWTWLPLLTGVRKLVLAGDHLQLPPTVLSQLAQDKNMKQSLFERIYHHIATEENKPHLVHSLTIQYRMHPTIATFPSHYFYKGELKSEPTLETTNRSDFSPYVVFDILDGHEETGQMPGDLRNSGEAELISTLLQSVLQLLKDKKIGVITPYQSQKHCLERSLSFFSSKLNIVVNTIDGFQGQEKDLILLSCVRGGNASSSIGFLSQQQRLNVALTRARLSLVIVGSISYLAARDEAWMSLYTDAQRRNKVVPVSGQLFKDADFLKKSFLVA